jgi:hypothetical protein
MQRRMREASRYQSELSNLIWKWSQGSSEEDIEMWMNWSRFSRTHNKIPKLRQDLEDHIFDTLKARFEKRLGTGPPHAILKTIEEDIYAWATFEMVEWRLLSVHDIWAKKYLSDVGALQRLADDNQNVHTAVINKHIKDANATLDKVPVPQGQKTIDEIYDAWTQTLKMTWATIEPSYMDMLAYGKKSKIYEKDDYMYRKMLRQIWALIKTYKGDAYNTLLGRLYEECSESVGMCAHGHISRLANVMVGLHESFLSPRSTKEEFQDAIAALAAQEIPMPAKIKAATDLMDEMSIPQDERQPWLDAL